MLILSKSGVLKYQALCLKSLINLELIFVQGDKHGSVRLILHTVKQI